MKLSFGFAVTLFLLLFLFVACGTSGTEAKYPTPDAADQPVLPAPHQAATYTVSLPLVMTRTPPAETEDCTAGDPSKESPLYNHQVFRATSADGYSFTQEQRLIRNHASVPDGVIGPNGKQWIYFVNGEPGKHGIFVAEETGTGEFTIVDCVKLDGSFEGNAVDPDVVRLADGTYRLFYFLGSFVTPPDPNQTLHPIYSATSTDGINFTVEQKVIEVEKVTDPSVVQLSDGTWLMALARPTENNTMLAQSDDGLTFTLTGQTIDVPSIPELGLMADGSIRLYLQRSLISTDNGTTWTEEPARYVPGPDPSLVALPTGGYVMFYKKIVQP